MGSPAAQSTVDFQKGEACCWVECPLGLPREQGAWSEAQGAHLAVLLSVLRLCVSDDSIWWGQNKAAPL